MRLILRGQVKQMPCLIGPTNFMPHPSNIAEDTSNIDSAGELINSRHYIICDHSGGQLGNITFDTNEKPPQAVFCVALFGDRDSPNRNGSKVRTIVMALQLSEKDPTEYLRLGLGEINLENWFSDVPEGHITIT